MLNFKILNANEYRFKIKNFRVLHTILMRLYFKYSHFFAHILNKQINAYYDYRIP
jgi:hypothetical protein